MNNATRVRISTRATGCNFRQKWHILSLENRDRSLYIGHCQCEAVNALMIDRRRIRGFRVERLQPLKKAEPMSITTINCNIGPLITYRLTETPGRRLSLTHLLLIDSPDMGVAEATVKLNRVFEVAHVDADVGHPHNMSRVSVVRGTRYWALL